MPRYRFAAEYTTHCFRWTHSPSGIDGGTVAEISWGDGRFDLAPVGAPPSVRDATSRRCSSPTGCQVRPQSPTNSPKHAAILGDESGATPLAPVAEEEGLTVALPVGLTATVSTALAERGLSCNVIAGYHHDHLLVPAHQAETALGLLEGLAQR